MFVLPSVEFDDAIDYIAIWLQFTIYEITSTGTSVPMAANTMQGLAACRLAARGRSMQP